MILFFQSTGRVPLGAVATDVSLNGAGGGLRRGAAAQTAGAGGPPEIGRLKWWSVLFVALVIRAAAGDQRNWDALRDWAAALPEAMGLRETALAAD
jgi:hypothetical protein